MIKFYWKTSGYTALLCALALNAAAESIAHTPIAASVPSAPEGAVLASYRGAVLSHTDFDAFLATIPSDERGPFLRSPERVERTIVNMLLGQRALDRARESGEIGSNQLSGRIRLESGRVAVEHLRQQYLDEHLLDDYEAVARELFLTRREEFMTPAKVDFAHVIIAPVVDGDPVAGMRQILALYDQALQQGDFRQLAVAVGEGADAYRAGGHHEGIALYQLEPALAQHLSEMRPGEISEPIRTASGWHIVQLTGRHEQEIPEFEQVREQAIEIARARHREHLIARFRNELIEGDLQFPEGAIREMLARHGVSWTREEG